jgi:hypothetical protein
MTKDNHEFIEDDKESLNVEENDYSKDFAIVLMNLLGPFSNWCGGTLLFIMYLYQNFNFEGSSFFSLRFWGLLFLGELILIPSLLILTFIFSFLISFICDNKKIKKVNSIRAYTLAVLVLSSMCILIFITWKFAFSSFSYTYGNFTLTQIIKATISSQEILNQPDGSIYIGQTMDEKPHGQGTSTFLDGSKYIGNWKNGKYHGQGSSIFPNGRKYEGGWKFGKPHGEGTTNFGDGDTYQGEIKNGRRSGLGTYIFSDGRKYVGEWKNDKINGQGTMTLPDGTKYVGEWKDSKKHGQGTFNFSWGWKYEGEYKDGKPWNTSHYDDNGKIVGRVVNGKEIKQ